MTAADDRLRTPEGVADITPGTTLVSTGAGRHYSVISIDAVDVTLDGKYGPLPVPRAELLADIESGLVEVR